MRFFWILWGIAALVGLVVLYFFFLGLADGSVSSFNAGLWVVLLLVTGGVLGGSLWLKERKQLLLAKVVLLVLAGPGVLAGLFLLAVMLTKPRWN